MKTMNCRQLGGACETEFQANSYDEIAEMSKQHGMEMYEREDEAHLKAMKEMRDLMQKPDAMNEWFENKKRVYAETCGLILAFLGSGGRNAAMIFSLRKSSSR